MFIVAVDYDQKNAVRGVYRVPDGMSHEDAEAAVVAAYNGEDDACDLLEEQGFELVSFLTTEIS